MSLAIHPETAKTSDPRVARLLRQWTRRDAVAPPLRRLALLALVISLAAILWVSASGDLLGSFFAACAAVAVGRPILPPGAVRAAWRWRRLLRRHGQGAWCTLCSECGGDVPAESDAQSPACPHCGSPGVSTAAVRALPLPERYDLLAAPARSRREQVAALWWRQLPGADSRRFLLLSAGWAAWCVGSILLLAVTWGWVQWLALAVVAAAGFIYFYQVVVPQVWRRVGRFARTRSESGCFHYCLECGYDLRGSLSGGQTTCPECGAKATTLQELAVEAR